MTPCSAETERGTGYNWTFRPISSALPFGKAPKTEPEAPVDLSQKFDPNRTSATWAFAKFGSPLSIAGERRSGLPL